MGNYVASEFKKEIKKKNIKIERAKVLIMGLTFKENCADIRNSGIKDVIEKLKKYKCKIDLYDPWVDNEEIKQTYGIIPNLKLKKKTYDGIIIAVAHQKFKDMGKKIIFNLYKKKSMLFMI